MAPHDFVKTYVVDARGGAGTFKTIREAYAAVTADRAKRIGAGGSTQSNPWDWRQIQISPGRYHEKILGVPSHTALVGTGQKPDDVYIWWDGGENTFESTGRSTYLRNLHLAHTDLNPDLHAMRDNGPAGDIDMQQRQRRTVIFDSVKFSSPREASLGKCTNDMAPRSGVSMVFKDCVFDGRGQPQSINLLTGQGDGPGPATIVFMGCEVVSNHEQHPSKEWKQLTAVDAAPLGVPDFSSGRGDRLVWLDGRWDVGKTHGVQGLMVFPYIKQGGQPAGVAAAPSTKYYVVNPGEVAGMRTVLSQGTLPTIGSIPDDLHLPEYGVGAMEAAFYGARPTQAHTTHESGAPTTGTMTLEPGVVHWLRLPAPRTALCASAVELPDAVVPTGAHITAAVGLDLDGRPLADPNGWTYGGQGVAGAPTAPLNRRWFYPGQGPLWVAVMSTAPVKVPSTAATAHQAFTSSADASGPIPKAGDDLSAVSAGTAIPHVRLIGQLPEALL